MCWLLSDTEAAWGCTCSPNKKVSYLPVGVCWRHRRGARRAVQVLAVLCVVACLQVPLPPLVAVFLRRPRAAAVVHILLRRQPPLLRATVAV